MLRLAELCVGVWFEVLDARTIVFNPGQSSQGCRLEYPDFQPAGDGGGLGELAVHGDRVRLVQQHLLVRVQVVKVETLWRMALLRTSGIFSSSFNLYILSQAKLPHFEVVPPAHYQS